MLCTDKKKQLDTFLSKNCSPFLKQIFKEISFKLIFSQFASVSVQPIDLTIKYLYES
jgi:hypothetical protein